MDEEPQHEAKDFVYKNVLVHVDFFELFLQDGTKRHSTALQKCGFTVKEFRYDTDLAALLIRGTKYDKRDLRLSGSIYTTWFTRPNSDFIYHRSDL